MRFDHLLFFDVFRSNNNRTRVCRRTKHISTTTENILARTKVVRDYNIILSISLNNCIITYNYNILTIGRKNTMFLYFHLINDVIVFF